MKFLILHLLMSCTTGKVILAEDSGDYETGTPCEAVDEVCDGQDNDCDSFIDEGIEQIAYLDGDADGFGEDALTTACELPKGTSWLGGDCDDGNAAIFPGAVETWYDGIDSNCDGANDYDRDLDGFQFDIDDCNDQDPTIHPAATEQCGDQEDEDCDGSINEDWAVDATCLTDDNDGDGYGAASDDCDDTNIAIYPGATEDCSNGLDDDCDGAADQFGDDNCL